MQPSSYTVFPSLHAERTAAASEHQPLLRSWLQDVVVTETQELVFAWAQLLASYTGEDEEVVFAVDGDTVKVTLGLPAVVALVQRPDIAGQSDGCRTGVFTESVC